MATPAEKHASMAATVFIDAPVEQVFAYYADPNNAPEYWPSMVEVRDVETEADGRPTSYRWVYKMAGMRFNGTTAVTEFVPNRHIVMESSGGISAVNDIEFETEGSGTRINERMNYSIPIPLLGRFAERFLLRLNQNELATVHANIKARMESDRP